MSKFRISHYTYKITDTYTSQFYYGRSRCDGDPLDHCYWGSSEWPRFNKKKYGPNLQKAPKGRFVKTILKVSFKFDVIKDHEIKLCKSEQGNPKMMNVASGNRRYKFYNQLLYGDIEYQRRRYDELSNTTPTFTRFHKGNMNEEAWKSIRRNVFDPLKLVGWS